MDIIIFASLIERVSRSGPTYFAILSKLSVPLRDTYFPKGLLTHVYNALSLWSDLMCAVTQTPLFQGNKLNKVYLFIVFVHKVSDDYHF